jgi:hypothetical protein
MVKRIDSKTSLKLFFVFVVLPTPAVLQGLGLWHHNDIFWRMVAQITFDGLAFLVLRAVWRGLPDAEPRPAQAPPVDSSQTDPAH